MSKVDWVQAEIDYVTKPKISYDIIAKRYKVAKLMCTVSAIPIKLL